MPPHKSRRQKGKLSFKNFFQKFEPGELVAVVRELSQKFSYKKALQGRTGKIIAKRGSAYQIRINDLNKPKIYHIKPIHLRKIQEAQ